MDEIQNILNIAEEHFARGNGSPEILEFIQSFPTNIDNLPKCQAILEIPDASNNAKVFASDSFRSIIRNFLKGIDYKFAFSIVTWIEEYLQRNTGKLIPTIIGDLGASISSIFTRFILSADDHVSLEIGHLSQFIEMGQFPQWAECLILYNEIINGFLSDTDLKTMKMFISKIWFSLFNSAQTILTHMKDSSQFQTENPQLFSQIITLSCNLISKCFQIITKSTNMVDQNSKSQISSPEFVDFFYYLYIQFLIPDPLDVISNLLTLTQNTFVNNSIGEIMNHICGGMSNILRNQIGFDNPASIFRISTIISNIPLKLDLQLILNLPTFNELIELVSELTKSILQNDENQNSVSYLLKFWESLEKVLRGQESLEVRNYIATKMFDIFVIYINLLIDSCESGVFEELDLLSEKICPMVLTCQYFISFSPATICPHIQTVFHEKKTRLFQAISSNQPSNIILLFQKQLALVFQIMITLISTIREIPSVDVFASMVLLIQETSNFLPQGVFLPELEMCFLLLINNLKNTIFGSTIVTKAEVKASYFQRLSTLCPINSEIGCQDFFFTHCLIVLSLPSSNKNTTQSNPVVDYIIKIFNDKINPTPEAISQLLVQLSKAPFPFMITSIKQRRHFFSAIMSLVIKTNNSILFDQLLAVISPKFDQLTSQNELVFLINDIIGLFSNTKRTQDVYLRLFNSLFPDKMTAFAQACSGIQDPGIFNMILKMTLSIVNWSPTQKIVFPHSSPNGIILFKFASTVIMSYFALIQSLSPNREFFENDGYMGLRYTAAILENLLTGGYVVFGAFVIYNDAIFVNVFSNFVQLLNAFDFENISTYPKTFGALIKLFKALCTLKLKFINQEGQPEQLNQFINLILTFSSKAITDSINDTSTYAIETIDGILQFIVEEPTSKEFSVLMANINQEILSRACIAIWQYLINSRVDNAAHKVSFALKTFMRLNPASFQFVKEKVLSSTKPESVDELAVKFNMFQGSIKDMLETDDIALMRKGLSFLKNEINSKVVVVSLL